MLERPGCPTIEELDERVRAENRAIRRVYGLLSDYHITVGADVGDTSRESFGR